MCLLPPLIALMMETASTSETSVNLYQKTRRNNPEDSHLHIRCRENLKSHKNILTPNFLNMFSDPTPLINLPKYSRDIFYQEMYAVIQFTIYYRPLTQRPSDFLKPWPAFALS
jgi:hypothetical protein